MAGLKDPTPGRIKRSEEETSDNSLETTHLYPNELKTDASEPVFPEE